MGNDASKVEEIVELIKNDDFCSFASQIAENEAIIKDSDDYGRTLLWVSWMEKIQDSYMILGSLSLWQKWNGIPLTES